MCGMSVDEKKAVLRSAQDGKTFYFCSARCKSEFDRDPHKYARA